MITVGKRKWRRVRYSDLKTGTIYYFKAGKKRFKGFFFDFEPDFGGTNWVGIVDLDTKKRFTGIRLFRFIRECYTEI